LPRKLKEDKSLYDLQDMVILEGENILEGGLPFCKALFDNTVL
jgi:hypothetical protein